MIKMKNNVNKFTDLLVADSGNEDILFQTDFLTIQISLSDKKRKEKADQEAIARNLSLIEFRSCENHLRQTGVIKPNDSIKFSKTDWDSELKTSVLSNSNSTEN